MRDLRTSSITGFLGPAVLLALLLSGIGCGSPGQQPAEPSTESAAATPATDGATEAAVVSKDRPDRFEGEIGHFGQGEAFTRFVFDHELKVVFLDAELYPGPFDDEGDFAIVNDSFGVGSFVLWDDCFEPLDAGEKPSVLKCTGTEISIDRERGATDSDLTFVRGTLRLKGYFVVQGCDGPFQGLMGCSLRPIDVDAAQ